MFIDQMRKSGSLAFSSLKLRFLARVLTSLSFLLILSCSTHTAPETAEIQTLLRIRLQALSARDISPFETIISTSYADKGMGREMKLADIAASFKRWDTITMLTEPPDIRITGNTATSITRYRLRVKKGEKMLELEGEETIRYAREGDTWKIISGL